MMTQLIFLGMAMGLNNALASVALGTMKVSRWQQLRTAIVFGLFEAFMPLIGVWVGEQLASVVGGQAKTIGIVVLVLVGLYALLKRSGGDDESSPKKAGMQTILLAVALSLDNLSVGFGLGMMTVPLGLAAITFGIVSLVMTLLGLEVGRYVGSKVNIPADKLSGVVLLVTAGLMWLHS